MLSIYTHFGMSSICSSTFYK